MSTANIENIDPAVETVERPGRIFIIDYKFTGQVLQDIYFRLEFQRPGRILLSTKIFFTIDYMPTLRKLTRRWRPWRGQVGYLISTRNLEARQDIYYRLEIQRLGRIFISTRNLESRQDIYYRLEIQRPGRLFIIDQNLRGQVGYLFSTRNFEARQDKH